MSDSAPVQSTPAESPKLDRAYTSAGAWLRFITPAVMGLAADLWLKYYAFPQGVKGEEITLSGRTIQLVGMQPTLLHTEGGLINNPPIPVIPHILGFTTTVNQGAVFGIGQGMVGFFLIFSIIALALIIWVFISSRRDQWVVQIALGMITAGALGNLYDRALFNGVRDMLRFYVDWYPYIFNIADVMLCIGVPLLMLCWLFVKEPKAAAKTG